MSRIKWTILRYYLIETIVEIAILLPLYLLVTRILKIDVDLMITVIWLLYLVIWLIAGNDHRNGRYTIEYWVQPKFRDEVLHALAVEGFMMRMTEENKTLFEKRLRFGRRYFATLTDLPTHLQLRIAEKYEKPLDAIITTDMLAGGGYKFRKWGLSRYAKTPKSGQLLSQHSG